MTITSPASTVFAQRLREIREARGMSRPQLARLMTERGRPMTKLALHRIENGDRKVSLDEAIAFAETLRAALAALLSPAEGTYLALTDKHAVDGAGLRQWLVTGHAVEAWPVTPVAEDREHLDAMLRKALAAYAIALVDAGRVDDLAGAQAAIDAIEAALKRHHQALAQMEKEVATDAG